MKRFLFPILFGIATTVAFGEGNAKLLTGPMIGYSTMAETMIWVQTDAPGEVIVEYWNTEDPETIFQTDPISTEKKTAFVAKCIVDQVTAGTTYGYRVRIDGKLNVPLFREGYQETGAIPLTFATPKNWRFRETGHQPFNFSVALGSCAYINEEGGYDRLNGKPYGGDYQIFESIYEKKPELFVWLGDNIYLREPDWTSKTGIYHRWTHTRSTPEMRAMLATMPNYSTWDDHDYGPNNSGWDFWNKEATTDAFNLFSGNASAGLPELPGIFTFFNWGDVNFYLLDNRTYRTYDGMSDNDPDHARSLLGKKQIDWLINTLKYRAGQTRNLSSSSYPSTFNVICIGNQVFSPYSSDSYTNYTEEFEYLMDRIVAEKIGGVVFVSGDVHFGEVSQRAFNNPNGDPHPILDITTSPLTSGSWSGSDAKDNPYRVDIFPGEADRVAQRNFVTLSFEGSLKKRTMIIRYFDSNGVLLNQDPNGQPGEVTEGSRISIQSLAAPK